MTTIFFDHHSTTPPSEAVIDAVASAMRLAGNASSSHEGGRRAMALVEEARHEAAQELGGVDPAGIVFCGSATEASNLLLKGAVERWWMRYRNRPRVAVLSIAHSSEIAPVKRMVERGMCDLDLIPVGPSGIVNVRDVASRIYPNTAIVAVQSCNNEVGSIQPVAEIAALCRRANVLYSCDASQDFAKVPHDFRRCSAVVAATHKIGVPVGLGLLYIDPRVVERIEPQILGGTQQLNGMRGGTLPHVLCAALTAAIRGARDGRRGDTTVGGLSGEQLRLALLRDNLLKLLSDAIPEMRVNGARDPYIWEPQATNDPTSRKRIYCNLNLTIPGICPIATMEVLQKNGIDVSAAAACKSLGGERSHVLEAIGAPNDGADLRFGLGRCNTADQVRFVAQLIADAAERLRGVGCDIPASSDKPKT